MPVIARILLSAGLMVRRVVRALPEALLLALACVTPWLFTSVTPEASAPKVVLIQVGAALLLLLLANAWLDPGSALPRPPPLPVCLLAVFFLANVTSLLCAAAQTLGLQDFWRISLLLVVCVSAAVFLSDSVGRHRLALAIGIGALPVMHYAMVQRLGLDPWEWSVPSADRVFSTLGNPNMLAGYCVATLPFCLYLTLSRPGRFWRAFWASVAGLTLLTLAFTLSKGGLLGLVTEATLALACVWQGRRTRRMESVKPSTRGRAGSGWHLALAAAGMLLLLAAVAWPMRHRFEDIWSLGRREVSTSNVRLVIWKGAWRMFSAQLLTGAGPGAFGVCFPRYRSPDYELYGVTHNTQHAHSEILQNFSELGLPGGLAFAALMMVFLVSGWRQFCQAAGPERLLKGTVLCAFAGLLAHSCVCVITRWPTCGLFLWLLAGLQVNCLPRPGTAMTRRRHPAVACGRLAGLAALTLLLGLGLKHLTIDAYCSETAAMAGIRANEQGCWQEAEDVFERAVTLSPANARAYYGLGYSRFQRRAFGPAIAAYHRLQCYAPDFSQVHLNLGACYLELGRWNEAAAEYASQQRIGGLPAGTSFEEILSVLQSQLAQGRKYRETLEHLLSINPDDRLARNMLGNHLFATGAYGEARRQYEEILRRDPEFMPALNNLAGIYFVDGDYRRARYVCLRITAKSPQLATPWCNLGKACYMLGRQDEARQAWQKAAALAPADTETADLLQSLAP